MVLGYRIYCCDKNGKTIKRKKKKENKKELIIQIRKYLRDTVGQLAYS